ncbi:hypothetical protein L1049_008040 [Liquidambar formosana]|uniref:Cytochrome P450 n=1 Tax=Liquidambar formosana TaxID=63359 RepID=A0AAP0SA63_LIQFO
MNSEGVMDEQGLEFKAIWAEENRLDIDVSLAIVVHIPWLRWMFEVALTKHWARWDRFSRAIMEEHTQHTLARKRSGNAKQHFMDALLTQQEKYDLSQDTIIGLVWDMVGAGIDTTAISVEWAMAELLKNPRVQDMAQEELDRVIGAERVMTELDSSNLPYLQCVGSMVEVNVWAVARDPTVWRDPLEFRPERFLEEDVDMNGHDFRLPAVCPPKGVKPKEIDMAESPGLVTYMRTPLQAIPTPRLPAELYKRISVDRYDMCVG